MPNLTVNEVKTLFASVPTNRGASILVVPDDSPRFAIVTNYAVAADGSITYTTQGYINWLTKAYETIVP